MDLTNENFVKAILQSIEESNAELTINKKELKKGVVAAGNSYTSEITQLDVEYTKDGIREMQSFILKIFSAVATYELSKEMGAYDKEVEMYKTALPAMAELLNEPHDLFFPKVFKSIYPDVLVLENLMSSGYVMMDKKKQLDFEHAAVAFKTLAKFHALSIRLNEKSPEIIDKVKANILFGTEIGSKVVFDMYDGSFDLLANELRKVEETSSYVDSFVNIKRQIFEKVKSLFITKSNKMQVLNHGDHHHVNMMFRHDHEGNVIDNKLIDFQVCRWCSLAIDIWYFAVLSLPFDVFSHGFDNLIALYCASLNDTLEKTSSVVRFTIEEIKKEVDDSIAFGVNTFIGFLPSILVDSSNPVGVEELVDDKGNFTTKNFLKKSYGNPDNLKIFVKWFLYFIEKIKNDVISPH